MPWRKRGFGIAHRAPDGLVDWVSCSGGRCWRSPPAARRPGAVPTATRIGCWLALSTHNAGIYNACAVSALRAAPGPASASCSERGLRVKARRGVRAGPILRRSAPPSASRMAIARRSPLEGSALAATAGTPASRSAGPRGRARRPGPPPERPRGASTQAGARPPGPSPGTQGDPPAAVERGADTRERTRDLAAPEREKAMGLATQGRSSPAEASRVLVAPGRQPAQAVASLLRPRGRPTSWVPAPRARLQKPIHRALVKEACQSR